VVAHAVLPTPDHPSKAYTTSGDYVLTGAQVWISTYYHRGITQPDHGWTIPLCRGVGGIEHGIVLEGASARGEVSEVAPRRGLPRSNTANRPGSQLWRNVASINQGTIKFLPSAPSTGGGGRQREGEWYTMCQRSNSDKEYIRVYHQFKAPHTLL